MMHNILITGSTGMTGRLALEKCLSLPTVTKVTTITRKKSDFSHPKLTEIIHSDFLDFTSIEDKLQGHNACIYCLGVYTGQVGKEEFRKITTDYTRAFAEAIHNANEKMVISFLSGQGADSSEKSMVMFARDKGAAENSLLQQGFEKVYIFRPGYIYPVRERQEPNFSYKLMRKLYKPISTIFPNIGLTSEHLAHAMVEVTLKGGEKAIYENKDIRDIKITI
ncbi:MAG: NAD(P)H-binding protein [Spirochaetota bacterium]